MKGGEMDMRKSYPSDISREQFEEIREELAKTKKATHPRKYDLYDIFCAILYLLKEGCTWRAIPHDFPKWQNVRYHYDIWQVRMKMASAFLIASYADWSKQSERKMGAKPIQQ